MTRKTHLLRGAGSAIAAALVLGSTPLLAQDVIAPTTAPPPAAAVPPAAALPPATTPAPAPVMVSNPVVQDTPPEIVPPDLPAVTATEEPAASAAPPAVRETRTASRTANTAPAEPAAIEPVTSSAEPAPSTEADTVIAPVPPVATAETPAEPTQLTDETPYGLIAGLLAALGIVGLAGWGFVAIGRRRKFAQTSVPVPVVERPVVTEPRVAHRPAPTVPMAASVTPLATQRPIAPEPSLAHSGAAVALPREMPATFAERDALLRRMIEAKPDRANPFRSPKARARRARLIMQSLGRDFGDADPRIDLSQYASNWPSVARRKSAAA